MNVPEYQHNFCVFECLCDADVPEIESDLNFADCFWISCF